MNEKHICYLQQCDVTAKLSTVAHRCIVQLVIHMNQSSHSPGVPLCHTEVTKGLQVDNMDIGCTLVSNPVSEEDMREPQLSNDLLGIGVDIYHIPIAGVRTVRDTRLSQP